MDRDPEVTEEFRRWYETVSGRDQERIRAAVEKLVQDGKELRPLGSSIRILFVFDPRRTAVLLLGGDKAGRWNTWYAENVPKAEALYREYLDELRSEGEL